MRVLVAGIGNIFLSDDGFGVEVANRLAARALPDAVKVVDFGIRGVHLAYELLDGYHALVLIDAMPLNEPPGTLAVFEPEPDQGPRDEAAPVIEAHSMTPGVVLGMLESLGGQVSRTLVVGCQPASVEEGIGLSPAVEAAVDEAATVVEDLVRELCATAEEIREWSQT
ncbi:MAG: hydrogenase maturation protease [Acidimicrobiales bacterium]